MWCTEYQSQAYRQHQSQAYRQHQARYRIRRVLLGALTALLATSGAGMLTAAAGLGQRQPPVPRSATSGEPTAAAWSGRPMHHAEPTRVRIPAARVDAEVVPVGVDRNAELEVPPLDRPMLTGWYRLGPSPGEAGNAVIVGHVDSAVTGPAVFFNLGALSPGTPIEVARRDGSVARFRVDDVRSYPKAAFPHELVYGPGPVPRLRLVTCGGRFDRSQGGYLDNTIVFATLAGTG